MDATESWLSHSKYGYDFVVSTTEASLNSDLKQFLCEEDQPVQYICYLVDTQTGNPTEQISLEELMARTNGANPFEIAQGTPHSDRRVAALTQAGFVVGMMLQMGIPEGFMESGRMSELPAVVTLGDSANNVKFNLMCRRAMAVQNSPANGWGGGGSWDVYSSGQDPWIIETRVNLVMEHLDERLSTPYFDKHPHEKAMLLQRLNNVSASAFSLHQLMYDLDNASQQTVPTFSGVPADSNAEIVLQKAFVHLYSKSAREHGLPLVAITAVSHTHDPSQLQLTAFERQVSPVKDRQGIVIKHRSHQQQASTTLDYVCAANFDALPGVASFNWNWVLPQQIEDKSGVMAINRRAIGSFVKDQLLRFVRQTCLQPKCWALAHRGGSAEYSVSLLGGQTPQHATITDEGEDVVHIEYNSEHEDSSKAWATYAKIKVRPNYTCDVKFVGERLAIRQRLRVLFTICWDASWDEFYIFDKVLTDTYEVKVDEYGALLLTKTDEATEDHSQSGNLSGMAEFFTGIDGMLNDFKAQITPLLTPRFSEMPINSLQNFIFPGGKVFTFKNARFSTHQDLICDITYVDGNDEWQGAPRRLAAPEQAPTEAPAESVVCRRADNTGPMLSVTLKSELMQNYVQGQLASPTRRFQALQTADGHALVFAIDSASAFHVVVEQSSCSATGWTVADLSTALIQERFKGDGVVSMFAVGQSALTKTIGLVMVVRAGGTDHVFASLGNSSCDVSSWTAKPAWLEAHFDAAGERPPSITVAGALFADVAEGVQYMIVDINRVGSQSAAKDIARYYLDPRRSTGSLWVKHDVPVDIESGQYQSCVGRLSKAYTDGVFTLGRTGGRPQLVYVPVKNAFGSGPPRPVRLKLPSTEMPTAMAAARNHDEHSPTTDLYVVSGSTLYRVDAQAPHTPHRAVVTSEFVGGTDTLLAMVHQGVTTLWGRNASDQVYYLSCPNHQLGLPGSWSAPVPILSGIERISAYVNAADGGNTIFASGKGALHRISQATSTAAKVWRSQAMVLAAPPSQKALAFKSYTTLVHVADDRDMPAPNVTLAMTADTCTPVYINGLYYLLGPRPVKVQTDSTGSLSIVEAVESLNSATLSVTVDGAARGAQISPMAKSLQKVTALNTQAKLRSASFPAETVAGGVMGSPKQRPLVPPSVSDKDVHAVAAHMDKIDRICQQACAPDSAPERLDVVPATLFRASPRVYHSIWDEVALAAGDLFSWLQSGVEALVDLVYDAATQAWHFVATIAGKVYRAMLDTVHAVAGALEWVYRQIKTAVMDLIHYVEFLFEWDDIRRTKDVLHNIVHLYVRHQIDSIPDIKHTFDEHIAQAEHMLDKWAGMVDSHAALGEAMVKPAAETALNPAKDHTPASQLLAHHLRSHAAALTLVDAEPVVDVAEELIHRLLDVLSREGAVVEHVFRQLQHLAMRFASLSVTDVLRELTAILLNGVLSTTTVVVDVLLDVIYHSVSSAVGILTAKIHVPVISDMLNLIGVPDMSLLDLFTWIVGLGYTVIYKMVEGKAPFPDDATSHALVSAQSWQDLVDVLHAPAPHANGRAAKTRHSAPLAALTGDAARNTCIITHASAGFLIFSANFLNAFEAESPSAENDYSMACAAFGIVAAALQGGGDVLAPRAALQDSIVSGVSKAVTAVVVTSKVLFCGLVQKRLSAWGGGFSFFAASDPRATGAVVNALLVIPAVLVSGYHFYELHAMEDGAERSAGIVGEVTNLTQYVARISYAVAVNDKEPESRQVFIAIMAASNVAAAGLQLAEAAIH